VLDHVAEFESIRDIACDNHLLITHCMPSGGESFTGK